MAADLMTEIVEHFDIWDVPSLELYIEDSLKWFGLVAWTTYVLRASLAAVRSHLEVKRDAGL